MGMARDILEWMREKAGVHDLGVVITDSTCLPLRNGTVGTAIGFAGFTPIRDYRGKKDLFDRTMELSRVNVADGLAATATLTMGEGDESTPIIVIRSTKGIVFTDADHSGDVRINPTEDVFAPVLTAAIPASPALPTMPRDWSEGRAFFTLVAASSLDGIIAPEGNKVEEWASGEDQRWFHSLLPTFDATVLGRKTYEALPGAKEKRNRIVLTTGVEGIEKQDDHTWFLDPAKVDLMAFLQEQGWKNVGVTGGGGTYSYFLRNEWTDRLLLTVEPLVLGQGVRLFSLELGKRFHLARTTRLNAAGSVLLQYDIRSA
jgi:dihydrofolate reductase